MSQTTALVKTLIESGLSQMEISRRTGIPQPRLSRWAQGKARSTADDVLALVDLAKKRKAEMRSKAA